jgi:ComF family protein
LPGVSDASALQGQLERKAATTVLVDPTLDGVLDLVFPPVCVGCGVLVRRAAHPVCTRCRTEEVRLPPDLAMEGSIAAPLGYSGPWRRALHRLKYGCELALAGPLGRELARAPILDRPFDVVTPVPLHWRRRLVRGFNQVDVILRAAARHRPGLADRVAPRTLVRTVAGRSQAASPAARRRHNVDSAFCVAAAAVPWVTGRSVLVVDDVVTTGATLRASMEALRRAGAAEIAGLALLRTL